jgi:hypothetical protein
MVGAVRQVAVLVAPLGSGLVVDELVENVEGSRTAPTHDLGVIRPSHLDLEVAADRSAPTVVQLEPSVRVAELNGHDHNQS